MRREEIKMEAGGDAGDELLQKLFHLKGYETPESARMVRNKQNIMREVRRLEQDRRKSFSDLLEIKFPWFFAEPKYGVALLFVVFAGLQYIGVNTRHAVLGGDGMYTMPSSSQIAYGQPSISTNGISYPEVPDGLRLFQDRRGAGDVKWVSNPAPIWDE